jgi:hypothetical protein
MDLHCVKGLGIHGYAFAEMTQAEAAEPTLKVSRFREEAVQ